MIRPQPMIVVQDVKAASRWFQEILGLRSGHGGDEYEMLLDGDALVVQLHRWDAHEHPHMGDASEPSRGNGVLLWFATDDFDALAPALAGKRLLPTPLATYRTTDGAALDPRWKVLVNADVDPDL